MKMSGNAVLITGGASGIGYSMAKYFLRRDNAVLICGRRVDRLAQVAQELPGIKTRRCDVTDPDDRLALFAYVKDAFPDLNILVNNAGIQRDMDLTKGMTDFAAGESEIRVNLEAPVLLSALLTPLLAGRENATIINVTSGLAFMPDFAAGMPLYHTTKAALHAFSVVQRKQLAALGVRVIELIPPMVDTELNPEGRGKRQQGGAPYMMAADDYVEQALEKMAQGEEEIRLARK